MTSRQRIVFICLIIFIAIALPTGLLVGGVELSASDVWNVICGNYSGEHSDIASFIVIENRLPSLLTALLGCAALSVAGLLMQTCFNNPLAGPSIMGISSGASLGVAVVIMLSTGLVGLWGKLAIVAGATTGAMAILGILLLFSSIVRSADVLLIIGILIGYLSTSMISLLNFFSSDTAVHSFVIWGLGTFSTTGLDSLPLLAAICLALILCSFLYSKSLNAMLLGQQFAENVGVSTTKVRTALLFLSGGLTAAVTAWCGPIGFVGLVVPHIARMLLTSSNHRLLLPGTALCGGLIGLVCQLISAMPAFSSGAVIPINAITPFIGVPVIIFVLLNRKKLLYFN